jgi:hypothetical protein
MLNINCLFTEMSFFLEDSAERADLAENQLGKLRAKNRSTVSASRASPSVSFHYKQINLQINFFNLA